MGLQFRPAMAPALDVPADAGDGQGCAASLWESLARKYWLDRDHPPTKVKPDVITNELWRPLEQEGFTHRSLAVLESFQVLERFLWSTYSHDASNHHVVLIAVFFNVKQHAHLQDWSLLTDSRPQNFSTLMRRVLSLNLDSSLTIHARLSLLTFVLGAFQSLENEHVRRECAPLVSVATWHNIHNEEARDRLLEANTTRRKAWRAAARRFDAADAETQSRLRFDRAWLFAMLVDFIARINVSKVALSQEMVYCERFLEFLIDLVSHLPTRRYTNPLLLDLNILPIIRTSKLCEREDAVLVRDLTNLLEHFQTFAVDDLGSTEANDGVRKAHYQALERLQRLSLQHFESKLKVLALSNLGSISKRSDLESHFSALTDNELQQLCMHLGLRTTYPTSSRISATRAVLMETLLYSCSKPRDFRHVITQLSVLPTARSLYDPALLRNEQYDGSRPLAIPKLNLQYLTLSDFMWRAFQLYRGEAFYAIRKDMESILKRMKPKVGRDRTSTTFEGFSRMALPIAEPAIIEVGLPKVGHLKPSFVRAEVILDVSRLTDNIRREWDNLRPHDTVFLMAVEAPDNSGLLTNGHSREEGEQRLFTNLRAAEVVQVLDDNGRALREAQTNGYSRPRRRRLLLDLDATSYANDKLKSGRGASDTASLNVIARRQGRENNFKPVLETIQSLVASQTSLPSWLQEVYLGYGDPKSASILQFQNA